MEKSSHASGGIGFFGLLTIVFITLKLCGVISWSWFWVLSPIIIPFGILALLVICAGIAIIIGYLTQKKL